MVIAGRIPSLQETLGTAARLVEPLNVKALAREMIDLLEGENQRQTLGAAGPGHAGKFSWEKTARLTLGVYQKLLQV